MARQLNIPTCLLTVDAEKVFDWVSWCPLEESLQQIGLKDNLYHKILALYNNPTARFRASGCSYFGTTLTSAVYMFEVTSTNSWFKQMTFCYISHAPTGLGPSVTLRLRRQNGSSEYILALYYSHTTKTSIPIPMASQCH